MSRTGADYQPLQHEVAGQTLYPEQFGEFAWEQYPEVPEENQLFDRQRVRIIIKREF